MTKEQAIAMFGTQTALALALGIKPAAVSQWVTVPKLRQYQIAEIAMRQAGLKPAARPDKIQGMTLAQFIAAGEPHG